MKILKLKIIIISLFLISSPLHSEEIKITKHTKAQTTTTSRKRLGYIEKIKILPENILMEGKLAPSINGNYLHAENIIEKKRGDKLFVTFDTLDKKGNKVNIKREVLTHNDKTYTVDMSFCIDNKILKIEFKLENRSRYSTHLKIGRDALAGLYLIDPGSTRLSTPMCKNK